MKRCHLFCIFLCLSGTFSAVSAQKVLDGVIAVVGNSPILQSDLEAKRIQAKQDSVKFDPCSALEDMLFQKLLLAQAIKDSVTVTDEQVEDELDRRLRHYIGMLGSVKAFEDFYGKSVERFKAEFKDDLRDVMLVQKMQAKITEGITVSPSEIREFFEAIPKDSIPLINAEVEVGHITRTPRINPELKKYARERLQKIRQDIIDGKKDFATAAIANSMDPGSAMKGGSLGTMQRGMLVPEFEAVAFRIKEKEVSDVFETEYGYHILMVDARRGEEVDVRHILIIPQASSEDMNQAKLFLDSIADLVRKDSISLTEAASRFSDDEETNLNGGLITNPYTNTTRFEVNQLSQVDPNLVLIIANLKPGELTRQATQTSTKDGKQAYHLIFVKSRTEAHRANLKDDYQRIQEEALAAKKERIINEWISKKVTGTYVHIADEYKNCKFENNWVQKHP